MTPFSLQTLLHALYHLSCFNFNYAYVSSSVYKLGIGHCNRVVGVASLLFWKGPKIELVEWLLCQWFLVLVLLFWKGP